MTCDTVKAQASGPNLAMAKATSRSVINPTMPPLRSVQIKASSYLLWTNDFTAIRAWTFEQAGYFVSDISAPFPASGNGVVVQLLEKQAPTEQEFTGKKEEIRQSLIEAKQNDLFALFLTNLRQEMQKSKRVKLNTEELKNLTRQGGQEGS